VNHLIKIYRMHLNDSDYSLMIGESRRVAVVYMVYGYLPEHYTSVII